MMNRENATFILTERRAQIQDLDMLPRWDRSLINYRQYHKYVGQAGIKYEMTIQGTRGCPYKCFYCDVQHITPLHRRRSVDNIFAEVEYLESIGVRRCEFIDDAFNVNKKDFAGFFKKMIDANLNMSFYFQSGLRGDLLDPEIIDLMVEGGTKSVNLSLESASPRLQKLMGKNLNVDKLYNNIQYITQKHPNLILGLNAMHGFPTETEAEAQSTIDFIKNIKWLHFVGLHNVRIFPGSRLEQVALANGVTKEQIEESLTLPYHLLPTTIQLDPAFSRKVRLDFVHNYIFNKERLTYILNKQLEVCSENELKFKYQTIFPTQIKTINDILKLGRLKRKDIHFENMQPEAICEINYPELKIAPEHGYKILFIDASQFFKKDEMMEINAVEPPLGFMSILTYLNKLYGDRINGKIIKTGVEVDSFIELQTVLKDFQPDLIGIRTMTYFKDFFSEVVEEIRKFDKSIPIIAGGPHPTIVPEECLRTNDIQACVIGEGEITCADLIEQILNNDGKFLDLEQLKKIQGLAFLKA